MKQQNNALSVAWFNTAMNSLLAVCKITVGLLWASTAMLSDGVHSIADALSGVVVIVGIRLSSRRVDKQHPYGHERMECVAAVLLAVVIGVTGVGIGVAAVDTMRSISSDTPAATGYAWVMAVAAIAVKEAMYRITRHVAIKTGSSVLLADAWHQRTDALSSFGGLIGVIGANCGVPLLDPLAGAAIALLIVKAAVEIFMDAMRKMTDRSCDDSLSLRIRESIDSVSGVCAVRDLKTRLFGDRVLVEVTVQVESGLTAESAYAIAKTVKDSTESGFEEVKMCSVHILPSEIEPLRCKTGEDVV